MLDAHVWVYEFYDLHNYMAMSPPKWLFNGLVAIFNGYLLWQKKAISWLFPTDNDYHHLLGILWKPPKLWMLRLGTAKHIRQREVGSHLRTRCLATAVPHLCCHSILLSYVLCIVAKESYWCYPWIILWVPLTTQYTFKKNGIFILALPRRPFPNGRPLQKKRCKGCFGKGIHDDVIDGAGGCEVRSTWSSGGFLQLILERQQR